jgi:hypothetical protein
MRLTLRVICAISSFVVALFFAKLASADTIPNQLENIRNNVYAIPQGNKPITSYTVLSNSWARISASGYTETEELFIPPSDEDYDDAFVINKAAPRPQPEPGNFVLLGSGLLTAASFIRRRRTVLVNR